MMSVVQPQDKPLLQEHKLPGLESELFIEIISHLEKQMTLSLHTAAVNVYTNKKCNSIPFL